MWVALLIENNPLIKIQRSLKEFFFLIHNSCLTSAHGCVNPFYSLKVSQTMPEARVFATSEARYDWNRCRASIKTQQLLKACDLSCLSMCVPH